MENYLYNYETLYNEGQKHTMSNTKEICIKAADNQEIWIHKKFAVESFEYFEGLVESKILKENSELNINKQYKSIDFLMRCVYGIDVVVEDYSWDVLLEVLELHDYLCPTNHFINVFENRYKKQIIETLINDKDNVYDILEELEFKYYEGCYQLRELVIRKHSDTMFFNKIIIMGLIVSTFMITQLIHE